MSATVERRGTWRTVTLADGRRARVAIARAPDGGRVVLVRILKGSRS